MAPTTRSSLKLALVISHFLQWAASAIVVGIVSYYISKYSYGQHLKYEEIIACISLGLYLPSFILPFLRLYRNFYLPLDIIFSYLWLTAFIFTAQDYNERKCKAHSPPRANNCSLKFASEAFCFIAFFFSLTSMILEGVSWASRKGASTSFSEKPDPTRVSADTAVTA